MASISTKDIRNVVLLSHSGAGKTTLSEAMLFATGATSRMGRVEDGNTVSDWEPEEAKRRSSIQTSLVPCIWNNHKINLLDTPGYADFKGEVVSALRVADGAVLLVSGTDGVQVGTEESWKMIQEKRLPTFILITKLDKDNTDFKKSVQNIENAFGKKCVPVQIPIGSQAAFKGIIDLMTGRDNAPNDVKPQISAAWDRLVEAIAETNDELATKYLEGKELSTQELSEALSQGIRKAEIVPILAANPTNEVGVKELTYSLINLMPSPMEVGPAEGKTSNGEKQVVTAKDDSPLAAFVFKTAADPYVGKLTYFRVYSGTMKSDSQVWNANKGQQERVGQVFVMKGKNQENVSELPVGDIGAVAKLSVTATGDTLCAKENPVLLEGIQFPEPVFTMALYPKTKADTDKMTGSVAKLLEEDHSLRLSREPDTGEVLLSGFGETHIDIALEKLHRKFGVEVIARTPKVPYKETITATTKVEYKHKKQSGGHGQYGHVWLELEPLPKGSGFQFDNKVVGGAVPKEYIPSVEKGVVKAMTEGVLAGYPIVDVKVTVFDGSYHPVDSSGVCFEIAGSHAFSKGVKEASPVLLEPIMSIKVVAPDSFAGDIIGGLNSKRARIHGMAPQGNGSTIIDAEAALSEMLRYATDLRSITQGRGSFSMKFDHYEEVPQHLTSKIVESLQKEKEEVKV